MNLYILLLSLFVVSWLLTAVVISVAGCASLIDVPNARSSHRQPTPRGGGLAIVVTLGAASLWISDMDSTSSRVAFSVMPAAIMVALIGFVDDRWQLPAWPRALVQIIASGWVLHQIPGLPAVEIFGLNVSAGFIGVGLAILYLVWSTNLFNFMDGIDGIAASQAIFISVGTAILLGLNRGGASWLWPMAVASCCAGFLAWNWPPARIFLGDVGSGFLGFLFGGMTLVYGLGASELFWALMILQGSLIVDATTTIFRRFINGQKLTQAHCSHAYQFLARKVGHRSAMFSFAAITICWLFPLALLVEDEILNGAVGLVLAYGPLVVIAIRLGAGLPQAKG